MKTTKVDYIELREQIKKGLELSFKKLLEEKRRNGGEFVFSENGKIIRVKATDIVD